MNRSGSPRLILASGLLLVACSLIATLTPTPVPPDLAAEWLAGRPCRPPCFLGITPGRTAYDDALQVLNSDPHIANLKTYPFQEIRWRAPGSGYEDGDVQFYPDTKLTKYVSVYFTHRFTLDDVIRAYGAPSNVWACSFQSIDTSATEYTLEVIWLDQGFALSWFTQANQEPAISLNGDQFRVLLFAPSFKGFADVRPSLLTTDTLKPWEGPQPFSHYATSCPSRW